MNKILKSCLRIIWAVLAIILLTALVFACINRRDWIYDINYYLIWFILLSVLYFVLIYNTFKPQKWYKWILILVLSIVAVFVLYALFTLALWLEFKPEDEYSWEIIEVISIVLSIYWVLLIRAYKIQDSTNKKRLKTIIRIILPFILLGTWAWLTRAWAIPNFTKLDKLNPQVREVFYGGCECSYEDYDADDPRWVACFCVHKPIIYLYPTEETQVNITLWIPENLSHTYPKYNSEKWRNVIAQPNGDLEDMDTWRKLYALYREWKSDNETNFDEWFVVKWEDIIPFLEEKLAILWLNEREAEEFIVYRLPQMEDNAYNLIRFETKAEQDENMPLNITPKPDTVIRVMMDWKAINEPIDIPEQKLFTPERIWFTVVEWWGSPRN